MTDIFLFSDNAKTSLAQTIGPSATQIVLAAGGGALFPSPTAGQHFALTLNDQATRQLYEVCYCTARAGDTLTVVRAQEGTSARQWVIGDFAWNGPTKGQQESFVQYPHMHDYSISPQFGNVDVNGWVDATTFVRAGTNLVSRGGVVTEGFDNGANVRMVDGSYGMILRNDGADGWLLSTDAGTPYGSYNAFRPFGWSFATGAVTINGSATGGTSIGGDCAVGGFLTMNGFRSYAGAAVWGDFGTTGNIDCDLTVTAQNIVGLTGVYCNNNEFYLAVDSGFPALHFYQGNELQFDTNVMRFDFWRGDLTLLAGFDQSGNLLLLGQVYAHYFCDPRVKRDVEPYTRGLADVIRLAPQSFRYNGLGGTTDDGKIHYGLDASVVRPIIPEAVLEPGEPPRRRKEGDEEPEPIRLPGQLALDDKPLLYALINSVRELNNKIEAQNYRIASLEALLERSQLHE